MLRSLLTASKQFFFSLFRFLLLILSVVMTSHFKVNNYIPSPIIPSKATGESGESSLGW